MKSAWPTLVVLLCWACSHDCGTDARIAAKAAAGPNIQECGYQSFPVASCLTLPAAHTAESCIEAAWKKCHPAHIRRYAVRQDGATYDDLYVVPNSGGCELQIVRQYVLEYCQDPVLICKDATPILWENLPQCPFFNEESCTGGYQ